MENKDIFKNAEKNLIIFGAGVLGRQLIKWLANDFDFNMKIIAFIDNNVKEETVAIMGIPVYNPKKMLELEWDYVLIANKHDNAIAEMKEQLMSMGVKEQQIITGIEKIDWHFGCAARYNWIERMGQYLKMNQVKGNVAECGVYRGDCAKFINVAFPDRKLYLFDTFEGFKEEDLLAEEKLGDGKFIESMFNNTTVFTNTTIDTVMKKMTYPENVIIKQGWFPDSAKGVEDTFCFVNLDMDLYQPMLAALEFFWDKMESGGVILCHDYMSRYLSGVKVAIEEFEQKRNIALPKLPIGDTGSIALLKM